MNSKPRIEIDPKGLEQLKQEVAASIQSDGVEVKCPYCGKTVIAHGTIATCPDCKRDFEVSFML